MRLVYMEEDYKFKCAECIFKCKKRGDYNRHLTTNKHIKIKEGKKIYNCKLCDKIYLNRSGLWRHNKVCNTGVKNDDYKELYIDKLNFKEVDEKSFYGLAPGKTIRLKYGHFVSFNNYDKENNVVHVNLACPEKPKKIKGILNWVGSDYKNIIIRTFNGNDMTEIKCMGESSLTESSLTESSLTESSNSSFMCQFEKYGFYCVDQSSLDQNKLIFNETVKLKTTYN